MSVHLPLSVRVQLEVVWTRKWFQRSEVFIADQLKFYKNKRSQTTTAFIQRGS